MGDVNSYFETSATCTICCRRITWCGCANKRIMTMLLRDKGWTVGKYCVCPECLEKRRNIRDVVKKHDR